MGNPVSAICFTIFYLYGETNKLRKIYGKIVLSVFRLMPYMYAVRRYG